VASVVAQVHRKQVAPRVVRKVFPPIVSDQRDPYFIGRQLSKYRRKEEPLRTMQRIVNVEYMSLEVVQTQRELGFIRNMWYQSEPNLKERQLD
jgi:hypothetical protein